MCSFFNNLLTITDNNNTMYSKNRISNRNFHSKLPIIVFQINSISSIEPEEFRETSIVVFLFRSHFHGNGTQQDSVIDVHKCGNFPVNSFKLMTHVL